MRGRFIDSFDHYDTAHILDKWSATSGGAIGVITGTGTATIEPTNGRFGTACVAIAQNATIFNGLYLALDAQPVWVVGFALRPSTFSTTIPYPFLEIHDTFPNAQLTFAISPTGYIQVYRGDYAGTLLGTTSLPVTAGVYDYWEFAVAINPSSGSVQIRKNGIICLTLSGINTQATANSTADTILLGRTYGPLTGLSSNINRYDDLYIMDAGVGGVDPIVTLGDVHLEALVPDNIGDNSDWTPVGATPNWECTHEIPPDDDTTYVESNTPGDIDTYPVTPLAVSGNVPMIQVSLYARKDAAGARTIQPQIKQGSTVYDVGDVVGLSTNYNYYRSLLEVDPLGAPWTTTQVSADEFGVKEVS